MTEWVVFGSGSPSAPNETDGPIAVSTGFTINDAGSYWCTGVEFFASSTPPTGVSVALWDRNPDESPGEVGPLLAFEAAPGAVAGATRNRILFDTAVPVSAALFPNGLYVTMRSGNNYVASAGYFASAPEISGPITAYQNATVGFNGRFKAAPAPADASDGYPNQTFGGGGYWVSPVITDVDPSGPTDVEVTDGGPRGVRAGGSPVLLVTDEVVTDGGPRGVTAGGSPAVVEAGTADVTIADHPTGGRAGGSPAEVSAAGPALPDASVWPVLVRVLACLEAAVDDVEEPPLYRSIRVGDGIQANVSRTEDECCQGLAWVRPVSISPSNVFPTPESAWAPCPPGSLVVEVELGVIRCAPFMAPGGDAALLIPTSAQHAQLAYRVLADAAAMRRAACCLIEQGLTVHVGSWSPAATEANCAGGTMRISVAAPFCERTC